jgi:hypothetical protein
MNPAALLVLVSVDTEWDRVSAAKELLNTPCSSERGPDLHYGGARGALRATEVQTGYLSAVCWSGVCYWLPNICSWRPSLLRASLPGVQFNAHLMHPGDIVFAHACKLGLEGIVSKRLGSTYRSGRSPDWQWQTGRAYRAFRSLETTEAPQRMKIAPSWSGPSEQNQESAGVSNRGTVLPIPSFGSTCPSANISLVVRACHRHHSPRRSL